MGKKNKQVAAPAPKTPVVPVAPVVQAAPEKPVHKWKPQKVEVTEVIRDERGKIVSFDSKIIDSEDGPKTVGMMMAGKSEPVKERVYRTIAEVEHEYSKRLAVLHTLRGTANRNAQNDAVAMITKPVNERDVAVQRLRGEYEKAKSKLVTAEQKALSEAARSVKGEYESLRNKLTAEYDANKKQAHDLVDPVTAQAEAELAARQEAVAKQFKEDLAEMTKWRDAQNVKVRELEKKEAEAKVAADMAKAEAAPVVPAPAAPAAAP